MKKALSLLLSIVFLYSCSSPGLDKANADAEKGKLRKEYTENKGNIMNLAVAGATDGEMDSIQYFLVKDREIKYETDSFFNLAKAISDRVYQRKDQKDSKESNKRDEEIKNKIEKKK